MIISTDVFWEAVSGGDTGLKNLYGFMHNIVNFYNYTKDQKEIFVIDDNVVEDSLKDLYEKFGITSNEYKISRSNYLLIIDPNRPMAVQYSEFFEHVNESSVPTHLVVLSNDNDVCLDYLKLVQTSYPDIKIVQDVTKNLTNEELCINIKKILNTSKVFDVTEYCDRLAKESTVSPSYLNLFDSIVDEIHENNSDELIYICCGGYESQSIYTYLVVELYLRYASKFYCTPAQMSIVLNRVSTTLNTSDFYLFDEFANYIKRIPNVLVESRGDEGFITHIVNGKDLIFSVIYTELEESYGNSVFDTSMSMHDVEFMSLLDFYDLNTVDGCTYLKSKIEYLYKTFKVKTGLISAKDLIVFQKDSKTYIGYVYAKEVKLTTLALTEYSQIKDEINLNRLRKCVPVSLFLDGVSLAKSIYSSLNAPLNVDSLFLPKQTHKMVILLNTGTFQVNDEWDSCGLSILDVGLSSKFTYSVCLSFYKNFESIIGLEGVRSICDCFGGFNPKLCRMVKI